MFLDEEDGGGGISGQAMSRKGPADPKSHTPAKAILSSLGWFFI
jgi:hypothetical protein